MSNEARTTCVCGTEYIRRHTASVSNEAAERLCEGLREHGEPETDMELILLDEALRTERRMVVEQVRDYLAIIEKNAKKHPRQMVEVTLQSWLDFWRNLGLDSLATGTEEERREPVSNEARNIEAARLRETLGVPRQQWLDEALRTERRMVVERLIHYVQHEPDCHKRTAEGDCVCGLATVLDEIGGAR